MKTNYSFLILFFCIINSHNAVAQGETCATAINISPDSLPYFYSGTTCGSLNDYSLNDSIDLFGSPVGNPNLCLYEIFPGWDGGQGDYISGEDLVFTFTPQQDGCYAISFSVSFGSAAGVHIFTECPDDGDTVACHAFGQSNLGGGSFNFVGNIGQQYYIVVSSNQVSDPCISSFTFSLQYNSSVINDHCSSAIPLLFPVNATTTGATDCDEPDSWAPENYAGVDCPGDVWTSNENGVWFSYSVTPSIAQPVTISLFNAACDNAGGANIQLGVWQDNGLCTLSAGTFVACAVGAGEVSITENLPVGDYYIYVDGNAGAGCDFTLTTSEYECQLVVTGFLIGDCNDNNTPSDPVDDFFDIFINAQAIYASTQFKVDIDGTSYGPFDYGTGVTISNLPADGQTDSLICYDANNASCFVQYLVVQSSCSNSCGVVINTLQLSACDDNGTGTDPGDDIFSVFFDVSGQNASDQYIVEIDGLHYDTLNYDGVNVIDNLPADGVNRSIAFIDVDDPACLLTEVIYQIPCSNNCPDYIDLTTDIYSGVYHAGIQLSASGTIPANQNVEFKAGGNILLEAGFSIPISTDFDAYIENCQ